MLYVALRYETICQTVKKCENWKGRIKFTTTNCYKNSILDERCCCRYKREHICKSNKDYEGLYHIFLRIRDYNLGGQMVN